MLRLTHDDGRFFGDDRGGAEVTNLRFPAADAATQAEELLGRMQSQLDSLKDDLVAIEAESFPIDRWLLNDDDGPYAA
ncbi:MAG: hypothetical protein AAFR38_00850 [Planctomycetota bacterium]